MKNLYKIGMLAVAALAFASCEKEVGSMQDPNGTHIVTIKATKDFDTKTAIDEKSDKAYFVWTVGDEAYFHIYENGVEAKSVTMSLDGEGLATFTATFDNSSASSYEYTAKYFKEESSKHNPLIVADQKPTLTSYDPSADVLIAQSQTKTEPATELQFALRRVATINKMTLKGMVPGEKIKAVELASDNQNFSAYYVLSSDSFSANGKKLTFDYSDLENAVVGNDGTFAVYFVSAPVEDASISVKVTTDQYVYERVLTSTLTLSLGTVKRFGISLEGYGEMISSGTVYTLVESADDLQDGAYYIIVGSKDGVFQAVGAQNANNRSAVNVTVDSDGTITLDNSSSAHFFVLGETSTGYTFWDTSEGTSGGYLYAAGTAASGTNYLRTSADLIDNAYWNISISEDGDISIASVNNDKTPYMRYNSSSNLFSCYSSASSQLPVSLYVDKTTCVELADPELSFDQSYTDVNWDEIESFTAPALNNPHGLAISYSSSEPTVATVDATSGKIAFVGNGETTITAKSTRTDVYRSGEASYVLTVTGKVDFESIAKLNAKATGTATMWDGHLENAIVSFVPDSKNAIIKDATGSVLVYINTDEGHGLKQGQTFTGYFTPTIKLFNGTAEITDLDEAVFEGEETVVEPESLTLADLVGNLAKYQNAYVVVEDLEVVSTNGKNINVKNGDNTYVVYSCAANATCVTGDIIKVTGTIAQYSSKDQVKAWTADDIVITQEHQHTTHTISFTQPEEGASFTVTVDGDPIESGTEVMEGTVVTLAATVSEGYTFDGWTVTGATVSGNTSTATITVGTSDIEIAASINKIVAGTTVEFTGANSGGMNNTQGAQTGTIDDVTISITSGVASGDQIRIYKNNTITISVPTGKTISKIVFTCTASGTAKYGPGCFEAITGYSYSGTVGTWTGSSSSVTLKADSDQVRATSIKVTYN